jgi:hypothetical protein
MPLMAFISQQNAKESRRKIKIYREVGVRHACYEGGKVKYVRGKRLISCLLGVAEDRPF